MYCTYVFTHVQRVSNDVLYVFTHVQRVSSDVPYVCSHMHSTIHNSALYQSMQYYSSVSIFIIIVHIRTYTHMYIHLFIVYV